MSSSYSSLRFYSCLITSLDRSSMPSKRSSVSTRKQKLSRNASKEFSLRLRSCSRFVLQLLAHSRYASLCFLLVKFPAGTLTAWASGGCSRRLRRRRLRRERHSSTPGRSLRECTPFPSASSRTPTSETMTRRPKTLSRRTQPNCASSATATALSSGVRDELPKTLRKS